jgi:hypothetical protein
VRVVSGSDRGPCRDGSGGAHSDARRLIRGGAGAGGGPARGRRLPVLMAAPAILAAVAGASAAQASCWRLPDQCYAMELAAGDLSIIMSGRRSNRDVVTLATGGDDGAQDEFLCFSEVRADGIFCANYFLCKPRGEDPAHIDSASPDVLEIRWRERAAELPTTAEVRHHSETAAAALTPGQWHSLPVRFRHWYSISSGAPQCRVDMAKD